jgi:hypothetical protein
MASAPVVRQPEHVKARRTAEVIGADRVVAGDRRFPVLFKAKCGALLHKTANGRNNQADAR